MNLEGKEKLYIDESCNVWACVTHSNSTPTTSKPSQTVRTITILCADLTSGTGGKVSLYPMVSVRGGRALRVSCTLLAVIEGIVFAGCVRIELAYLQEGKEKEEEKGKEG